MKKILISGYYGFDNFGDEAILDVLLNHLKGHQVTVLSSNPEKTAKLHNVHSINSFKPELVIKRIPEYDIVISGGGSLLQNVTSNASLMYYTGLISIAIAAGKKVIIFAQGIGPVKGFWSTLQTKSVLKRCHAVSVRDEKSLRLMQDWKINANLVCDPVFSLNLPSPDKTRKIGIQLRKFDTLTDELFDEIIKQISIKFSDREIELISFQDEEDAGISQVFKNKLLAKNPTANINVIGGLSNKQIINRVSEYDYLIAMRYHANLLGIKYGIKTLAIAYDPKVEQLAAAAGIPCLDMNSKKNDYNVIFEKLDKLSSFELLNFANSQIFEWDKTGIDELLKD